MDPVRRLATYADLLALQDDLRGEVIAGALTLLPSPSPHHGRVQRSLGRAIGGPFDDDDGHGGPGGWWIVVEVDVQLAEHDVVRPDLSGWRRARLPKLPAERPIVVRPDWVCEVLSPSNAAHDRVTKRRTYLKYGVPHYWLVDPESRTLEALRAEDGRWVEVGTFDERSTARIEPFAEIELDVGRLFPTKTD